MRTCLGPFLGIVEGAILELAYRIVSVRGIRKGSGIEINRSKGDGGFRLFLWKHCDPCNGRRIRERQVTAGARILTSFFPFYTYRTVHRFFNIYSDATFIYIYILYSYFPPSRRLWKVGDIYPALDILSPVLSRLSLFSRASRSISFGTTMRHSAPAIMNNHKHRRRRHWKKEQTGTCERVIWLLQKLMNYIHAICGAGTLPCILWILSPGKVTHSFMPVYFWLLLLIYEFYDTEELEFLLLLYQQTHTRIPLFVSPYVP